MDPGQARTLLEWYALAGVDEAIGEAPVDRFAAAVARQTAPPPAPAASMPAEPLRRPDPPPSPASGTAKDAAAADAAAIAAACGSLAELEAAVRAFDGCPLKATAKHTCFADGDPASGLMFIGEAPGRDEDLQGKPFVGRAGQLLDRMLAAIDRDRTSAYITNILFWRPPGNRNPSPAEVAACRPFVTRHIELAQPKVLVFLGGAAAKELLATGEGIMRLRGRWRTYRAGAREIQAMATLHPAYLLRQPHQKRLAWRDFLEIAALVEKA